MIVCTLTLLSSVSICVSAATPSDDELSPQASVYLNQYTAWAVRSSNNEIYVYYDVSATKTIGCLGAKLIVVQMKDASTWRTVCTYTGTVANGMLSLNDASHNGAIMHQGTSGTQYRAVVTIFGGSSTSNGDSRIVTTNTV